MSVDDEDTLETPSAATTIGPVAAEEADEDEQSQDFTQLKFLTQKKHVSAQAIRKGEKDFEPHNIQAQHNALEKSRKAMEEVLDYTRIHKVDTYVRGWYFPERWASLEDEGEEELRREFGENEVKIRKIMEERSATHVGERIVAIDGDDPKTMGRIVKAQGKMQPGREKVWLLPEETLYLVEKGSLDLWWPMKTMVDICPVEQRRDCMEETGQTHSAPAVERPRADQEEDDEYDLGVPLSLQAAYSLLIGHDGERGKVSLQKYQVYTNLSRLGYRILRAPAAGQEQPLTHPPTSSESPLLNLWSTFRKLLFGNEFTPRHPPYGPLIHVGLHRSYASIYKQLELIPRHKPSLLPSCTTPKEPFRVHYHVWKASGPTWSKTNPSTPPDFYICVVDANETCTPTITQLDGLWSCVPASLPLQGKTGVGGMYQRLKHGHRSVIVAVVDHGVVNYVRFAEGAFGEEELWRDFDRPGAFAGGKKRGGGGRGGSRGRGRGRGRGGLG